ncbi:MAG TPA: carbon monoxide dehydrogenase subunit G [Bryobacteraceae bacterium]|nr:carbon monoxide dehydrogenase subunit G [Bryobacteraceae bacterium]
MRIAGSHILPVSQERAYALLQDPAVLGKSMPGCDSLEQIGDAQYRMKMKMVLASVSGLFDGTVSIADKSPTSSFRLIVEGTGKIGFMKGDGLLSLVPADGGTNVQYEGSVEIGGTIAAVGQRLLDTTSKMIIKRFFDKLTAEVAAENSTISGTKSGTVTS